MFIPSLVFELNLMTLIQLVVFFRYRTLIPFLYALMFVETLLRMLVGEMKPVLFAHTPPGAISNYVMLPLVAAMLVLSLKRPGERVRH